MFFDFVSSIMYGSESESNIIKLVLFFYIKNKLLCKLTTPKKQYIKTFKASISYLIDVVLENPLYTYIK